MQTFVSWFVLLTVCGGTALRTGAATTVSQAATAPAAPTSLATASSEELLKVYAQLRLASST